MWTLPTGADFLSGFSTAKLQALYAAEQHPKSKLRLLAAVHRRKKKSIDEIAYMLSKPRRTVHGWLTRFAERGIKAKDARKQTGRPPRLTPKQRQFLVSDLERGPPKGELWSTKQVRDLLKRKYGVEFVPQHLWRLLTSLGFSMQKPRKHHYKAPSKEETARFKKKQESKPGTTERKDLLWARMMKQRSVSSRSSPVAGHDGAAAPS